MLTETRSTIRLPLPPARGTCRWAAQITDHHAGVLVLDNTVYIVAENRDRGTLVGFTLTKRDGTTYDLDATDAYGLSCSCPDATFRQERAAGRCKHARALRAALLALGVELPSHPPSAA
jgi:hypothetical protein